MTLLIATPNGVYGDKKISASNGEKCDPMSKVAANDGIVAGFAGDFELILKSLKEVELGVDDPKSLALCGQTNGNKTYYTEGIVVKKGRIYTLDCGRSWIRPKNCAFYAMGSGGTTAMSFLSGVARVRRKITEGDIIATFKYVSKCRDDCGSIHDFVEAP